MTPLLKEMMSWLSKRIIGDAGRWEVVIQAGRCKSDDGPGRVWRLDPQATSTSVPQRRQLKPVCNRTSSFGRQKTIDSQGCGRTRIQYNIFDLTMGN